MRLSHQFFYKEIEKKISSLRCNKGNQETRILIWILSLSALGKLCATFWKRWTTSMRKYHRISIPHRFPLEYLGNPCECREVVEYSTFTAQVAHHCSYCGLFQNKAASYSSNNVFKEVLCCRDRSAGSMIYPVAVRILLCWIHSGLGGNLQCSLQHRQICASQWCGCINDLYMKFRKYMKENCSKHEESC